MKKFLAAALVLGYLGQLPYQQALQSKVYDLEIAAWNRGGAWRRWCELRRSIDKDL